MRIYDWTQFRGNVFVQCNMIVGIPAKKLFFFRYDDDIERNFGTVELGQNAEQSHNCWYILLKGGTVEIFGNNPDESKFHSERNE